MLEESRFSGMVVLDRGRGADFAPWGVGQRLGAFGAAPLAPRGKRTEMLIEGEGQPPDPQQRMMWPQMSAVLSRGGWGSLTAIVSRSSPRTTMCQGHAPAASSCSQPRGETEQCGTITQALKWEKAFAGHGAGGEGHPQVRGSRGTESAT